MEPDYAPTANAELLFKVYDLSKERNINLKAKYLIVILSMVMIRSLEKMVSIWCFVMLKWNSCNYALQLTKHNVRALTLLTISDSLVTGEATSAEERQTTFNDMIKLALDIAISI